MSRALEAHVAQFEAKGRRDLTTVVRLDTERVRGEIHIVEGKVECVVKEGVTAWLEEGKHVATTWDDGRVIRFGVETTDLATLRARRARECDEARRVRSQASLRGMR